MKALDEGFAEFDKEAIQKLTDLAGDDLTNLTTKIRGLKKVDAEYQNFGGIYRRAERKCTVYYRDRGDKK